MDIKTTAILAAGSVEYSKDEAEVRIEELIGMLEEMKSEGVTHLVMSSGNYRGAQWQNISTDWSYDEDDEY